MAYNEKVQTLWTKHATLEFTRDRKAMSVIVGKRGVPNHIQIKGAPDFIVKKCNKVMLSNGEVVDFTESMKENMNNIITEKAMKALRTIGLAYKDDSEIFADYDGPTHAAHRALEDATKFAEYEDPCIFAGLVAMRDPPRPEVFDSIAICKKAGIRVCMITGDNKHTAEAIARAVGIFEPDENTAGKSFTGNELEAMDND